MKTTAIGETGIFSVGYRQAGRRNAKYFSVPQLGALGLGGEGKAGKVRAVAIALRADRLVARWRACAA